MATIKDVAKLAGVSVTTVSRVLNSNGPVNEKTREKIEKAIKKLDFTPSVMAQGMRTKKSKILGIIIPDYVNPFYYELFKYMEDAARQKGYHIVVASAGDEADDEIRYINNLVNRNIDGLIVCLYKGEQKTIEYLIKLSKDIPVVFMDNFINKKKINSVYTDGYAGIKMVTQHLIEKGHNTIGFIKPLEKYHIANDRYEGYESALKEAGCKIDSNLIFQGDYSIESGYKAGSYFLKISPKATAIVSATDLMAIGIINYFQSQGIKVPDEIAVAGFDDIYTSKLISPPLTTYKQPVKEIAHKAIELFYHKLNHPTAKNRQIVLEGNLVIRKST